MDDRLLGDVTGGRADTDRRGSYGSRDQHRLQAGSERAASSDKDSDDGRQDYFGVRSYLHQFYESAGGRSGRSSTVAPRGGSSKHKYDGRAAKRRRRAQCSGVYWWKTMAMFGAGCLLIGIVTIIAGLLIPPRPVPVAVGPEVSGDDAAAAAFDFRLEICRMIGLTMFCAGGLILAVSLMVPSFYRSCSSSTAAAGDEASSTHPVIAADAEEDSDESEGDAAADRGLPIKSAVPLTATPTEVQPAAKHGEAALITDSLIPYND